MTVQDWIEKNRIKCEIKVAPENPHMRDMPEGSSHWLATFSSPRGGIREMHVYYSTGPALTSWPNPLYGHPDKKIALMQTKRLKHPSGADVLSCVKDDILSTTQHSDAIEMAIETGLTISSTEDVDRARQIWNLISQQKKELIRLTSEEELQVLLNEAEEW